MQKSKTAVALLLIAVGMVFASLTSAMVVRRGLGGDWKALPLTALSVGNVLILVASSVALEFARRQKSSALWWLACGLGLLFLSVQLVVWRDLMIAGFNVATNPSSSFFYLISALHGVHALGGLIALATTRAIAATWYWHGMSILWVYLMLLFHWMQ